MHLLKTTAVFLLLGAGFFAHADQASVDRERKDLDRKESRELQKIDQNEEQERIKIRSRERDELAKIQRDLNASAGAATAAIVATGTMSSLDTAKLAQYKFLQDEVSNLIQNQLTAESSARFTHDRSAINRKYALERSKLDAQQIDAGDDTAKQRDTALKTAEITAKYQELLDDLAQEEALANAKQRFEQTTKINAGERDLSAFATKQMMAQMGKANPTPYNPTADPEYNKLAAVRDDAKNFLETSLDELRAKFNVKRTDINNAREDDLAKLSGS